MNTQSQDLSYFKIRLQELLHSSFPDKAHDLRFIEQRSSWAANAYAGAFQSGNPIDVCNEIADYILFEGLHFSRFDTVFQVVCNEFDMMMADEELRPFALRMLPICEAVFARYVLTDDFAYSTEYDLLYTEITGTIALFVEEHGI